MTAKIHFGIVVRTGSKCAFISQAKRVRSTGSPVFELQNDTASKRHVFAEREARVFAARLSAYGYSAELVRL